MSSTIQKRERKKPEIFVPGGTKSSQQIVEQRDQDEEEEEEEQQDQDDQDDDDDESMTRHASPAKGKKRVSKLSSAVKATRKKKTTTTKSTKRGKKATKEFDMGDESQAEENEDEGMFGALLNEASIEDLIKNWFKKLKANSNAAEITLLNFILQCCGCGANIIDANKEASSINLEKVVEDLLTNQQASTYPLNSKYKKFKRFSIQLKEFFVKFIELAPSDVLFNKESSVVNTTLNWLITISNSKMVNFRHSASCASMFIGSGLIQLVNKINKRLQDSENLLANELKKGRDATSKAKDLKSSIEALKNEELILYEMFDLIYKCVFMHRFRDTSHVVREDVMSMYGKWLLCNPDKLLTNEYTKYLGWVLTDENAQVRITTLKALSEVYSLDQHSDKFELFIEKFKPRLLSIVHHDPDDNVAVASIKILHALLVNDALDEEEAAFVCRLVFDERKDVRRGSHVFLLTELDLNTDNKLSNEDHSASSSNKWKVELDKIVSYVDDFFKYLKEEEDEDEEESDESTRAMICELIVDSFWESDNCCFKAWGGLVSLLKGTFSSDNHQMIAIELLRVATMKFKHTDVTKIRNKTIKEAHEKGLKMLYEKISPALPELFNKFAADDSFILELLDIVSCLNLSTFGSSSAGKESYMDLLNTVKDVFLKCTNLDLVKTAMKALDILGNQDSVFASKSRGVLQELVDAVVGKLLKVLEPCDSLLDDHLTRIDTKFAVDLSLAKLQNLMGNPITKDLVDRQAIDSLTTLIQDSSTSLSTSCESSSFAFSIVSILALDICWKFQQIHLDANNLKTLENEKFERETDENDQNIKDLNQKIAKDIRNMIETREIVTNLFLEAVADYSGLEDEHRNDLFSAICLFLTLFDVDEDKWENAFKLLRWEVPENISNFVKFCLSDKQCVSCIFTPVLAFPEGFELPMLAMKASMGLSEKTEEPEEERGDMEEAKASTRESYSTFAKHMRSFYFEPYLQSIFLALKTSFEEWNNEEFEVEDKAALEKLIDAGKKFARSLGVAPSKDKEKRETLVNLFENGIIFALEDLKNVLFLSLLEPFISKLVTEDKIRVFDFFKLTKESLPQDDINAIVNDSSLQIYKTFQEKLGGKKVSNGDVAAGDKRKRGAKKKIEKKKTTRKAASYSASEGGEEEEEEEEEENEEDLFVKEKPKVAAKNVKNVRRAQASSQSSIKTVDEYLEEASSGSEDEKDLFVKKPPTKKQKTKESKGVTKKRKESDKTIEKELEEEEEELHESQVNDSPPESVASASYGLKRARLY